MPVPVLLKAILPVRPLLLSTIDPRYTPPKLETVPPRVRSDVVASVLLTTVPRICVEVVRSEPMTSFFPAMSSTPPSR